MNDEPRSSSYKITVEGEGITIDREIDQQTALDVVSVVLGGSPDAARQSSGRGKRVRQKSGKAKRAGGGRRGGKAPGVIRDLSLRPSGKQSFAEFVAEKKPGGHPERQVVSVYYLQRILGIDGITLDHINTCYRGANWQRPSIFENSIQVTASRKHWLETSDMSSITLTTLGEDYVEHDLPKQGGD